MQGNIRINKLIKNIISAMIWLLLWEIIYLIVKQEILIVSPITVFKRIVELIFDSEFWAIALTSISRVLAGFLLAVITGVILAVITSVVPMAYEFFHPAISVIKATPITSFIILALVWIKSSDVSVFMAFLMVLPIIWGNVSEGIKNTDKSLLEMAEAYNIGLYRKIVFIYAPSTTPYFISAFKTGLGFSWKAGIAAEVIGTPDRSIGEQLYNAKIYLETVDLFAWTLILILISIIIEKAFIILISALTNKFVLRTGRGSI
jgi:NitT/TauT family transport system permease protein